MKSTNSTKSTQIGLQRRLNIEMHKIHQLHEIHIGSPRPSRPNCFVIDIMCLTFSVEFNKLVSISLFVICLYTRVLDFGRVFGDCNNQPHETRVYSM